jgi:exopolysaccharide biosynthesis polyprenyl glycosylphosphotransferase
MLKQSDLFSRVVVDLFAMTACLAAAYWMQPHLEEWLNIWAPRPEPISAVIAGGSVLLLLIALFMLLNLYDIPRQWTPFQILSTILLAFVITGVIYSALNLIFRYHFTQSRKLLVLAGCVAVGCIWLMRVGMPNLYGRVGYKRRVLIVGAHTYALRAIPRYAREHPDEIEVVGVVDDYKQGLYFENLNIRFFGGNETLRSAVESHQVDTIFVLHDASEYSRLVVACLDEYPCIKDVYVRAQIPLFMAQDIDMFFVQEIPLMKLYSRQALLRVHYARDIVDKCLAAIGLILTSPFFILMPILIRLDTSGPVFYRQKRLGLNNQPFWIFKFRSMTTDAEKSTGAVLAQKNDPRVTRIGRIMRATRIDELPQLLNVISGEMSMIGPRPERPEFQNSYIETIPWYPLRALCKPGITGLAQVSGEYDTSTQRKLLYDVSYLANLSPLLDLRILISTVVTVLTKRGH